MLPAIRATGLSKQYRLGWREPFPALRDTLAAGIAAPFRIGRAWLTGTAIPASRARKSIWAVEDVSFEIQHGEIVGLIGGNGSGKSTLLKILSRITEPTRGVAQISGRVGSLLEVGTGFHHELTGRENVFLNGAILGMRRAEIIRLFDEIVAFAEIEAFIDTPVKHYSTGMAVRLAFAVAAHLDTEILLVDEVLAVGDAEFQKKCLGKIGDVARQGRTVMLVSHDLTAIHMLCGRAMWLSHGRLQGIGPVDEQIRAYLMHSKFLVSGTLAQPVPVGESVELLRWSFSPNPVASGGSAEFQIALSAGRPVRIDELAVLVHDTLNRRVGIIDFRRPEGPYKLNGRDPLMLTARFASLPLVEGEYRIGASIRTDESHQVLYDLVTLDVMGKVDCDLVPYNAGSRGVVAFDFTVRPVAVEVS